MKLSLLIIGCVLLAGCSQQSIKQSESMVLVIMKPAQVTMALCTETGAMLHYRDGENIPTFLLSNADQIYQFRNETSLAFRHSKCDYSQQVTKIISKSVKMTEAEFTFKYDHDQAFRDSIQSYYFQ